MKLMTDEQRAQMMANHAINLAAREDDGNTTDFEPVLKLFVPWGSATWLLSEYNEDDHCCFGLCDLGMGSPELGYVQIDELEEITHFSGLKIERDLHFKAKKLLSAYAEEAREKGRILA